MIIYTFNCFKEKDEAIWMHKEDHLENKVKKLQK